MSGASRWLDAYDVDGARRAPAVMANVPAPTAAIARRLRRRLGVFTMDPFLQEDLPSRAEGDQTWPAGLMGIRDGTGRRIR